MNENTGRLAADTSGYGNHGTLTNMAFPSTPTSGWNPGKDGVALGFDGTDDYCLCPNDPINGTKNASFVIWLVPRSASNRKTFWADQRNVYTYRGWFFRTEISNIGCSFYVNDTAGSSSAEITSGFTLNNWHFVAGTVHGGNNLTIYMDNQSATNSGTSTQIGNNTNGIWFGRDFSASTIGSFIISKAYIFNRTLQDSEIWQLSSDPYCFYQQPGRVMYFVITGGQAYFKTFTESLTMQTQLQRSFGKTLIENMGFGDTMPKGTGKISQEIIALIDNTVRSVQKTLNIETLNLSDTSSKSIQKTLEAVLIEADVFSRTAAFGRLFSEDLSITTQLYKDTQRQISESLLLSDAVILLLEKFFSEVLQVSDKVSKGQAKTLIELLLFSEEFQKAITREIVEQTIISDVVETLFGKLFSETLILRDNKYLAVSKIFAETLPIIDSFKQDITKSFLENIAVTDTIETIFGKLFTERINLTDEVIKGTSKNIIETILLSDNFQRTVNFIRIFVAALTLTDSVSKQIGLTNIESLKLTDALSRYIQRIVTEIITVEDIISVLAEGVTYQKIFTEYLSIVDEVAKSITIQKSEALKISDIMFREIFVELAKLLAREILSFTLIAKKEINSVLRS